MRQTEERPEPQKALTGMDSDGNAVSRETARVRGNVEISGKLLAFLLAVAGVALASSFGLSCGAGREDNLGEKIRPAFSQALPQMDGGHLEVKGIEVTYAPGAASAGHSHPCPVIVYVVEGAIRSQVNNEPEAIYKKGESFYEDPNGAHRVSANASRTEPAKLPAIFLCDKKRRLSVPFRPGKKPIRNSIAVQHGEDGKFRVQPSGCS